MDILRAAQAEVQHARRDRRVGDLVDQDEAAERMVIAIGLEGDRLVGRQFDDADAVELECFRREMVERVDVDLVLWLLDRRRHALCRELERSEEHTSELQSLMRISYAVFCLKQKKKLNT